MVSTLEVVRPNQSLKTTVRRVARRLKRSMFNERIWTKHNDRKRYSRITLICLWASRQGLRPRDLDNTYGDEAFEAIIIAHIADLHNPKLVESPHADLAIELIYTELESELEWQRVVAVIARL